MTVDLELDAVSHMVRTVVPVWMAAEPDRGDTPICGGCAVEGWRFEAFGPRVRVTCDDRALEWSRRQVVAAVAAVVTDPDLAALLAAWRATRVEERELYVYQPAQACHVPTDAARAVDLRHRQQQIRTAAEALYGALAATRLLNRDGQLNLFSMAV